MPIGQILSKTSAAADKTTPEAGLRRQRGTNTAQKAGRSVVKISKDTGRKENLIGLVLWILFTIVYMFVIVLFFTGSGIPKSIRVMISKAEFTATVLAAIVCLNLGLLTARLLFRLYLRQKAYQVQAGAGWQDWRNRKKISDREQRL